MKRYQCPVCNKRVCDSAKPLTISKLSSDNEEQADVIIKCQCCKSTLAVVAANQAFIIENITPAARAKQ